MSPTISPADSGVGRERDVRLGEHAGEASVFDHRRATHLLARHAVKRGVRTRPGS